MDMKNIDFTSIETEQIDWDDTKVVDRVVRQYENFPEAFQKECIQNSWDARLDRKKGEGWEIKIYSLGDANGKVHVIIEDFGTKGMNKKRLDAFLSLWKPEKEHLDAGGQGQGKFVLMGASKENILIVESIDKENSYKCRFLQRGQKNKDNFSIVIKDLIPGVKLLNHLGTKIWIYDAKEDFLKIITSKEFINPIIESWWQVLGDRFNAKISLFSREIKPLPMPPSKEEVLLLENEQIKNFGRIKRLILRFHERPISEFFQGIRVQRANMMVTKIPFEIYEKEYKNRFSGYIEFDKDLEKLLKDIEKTDHCGFLYESPWKEIKNTVRDKAEKFVDKIIPRKEKRKTFKLKNLNQLVQKANQIISENCPGIMGPGIIIPDIIRKSKQLLRIKYLTINKREVKYGDIIKPHCSIINETNENKKILLKVELRKEGNRINKEEYKLRITSKDQKPIKLSEIELKKENYSKGKYTIRATLEENRHDKDSKATSFYLEIKREPAKKGFVKNVKFFETNEPVRNKSINKGIIEINLIHKDFVNIWELFAKKKKQLNEQIGFFMIKICLDEAINELFKIKLKDTHNLDLDDLIREINILKDKMYYEVYT
jgi:hypothetical protein